MVTACFEVSSEGPGSVLIHDDIQMGPAMAFNHYLCGYSRLFTGRLVILIVSGDDIISAIIIENGLVGLVNVTPMRRLLLSVVY